MSDWFILDIKGKVDSLKKWTRASGITMALAIVISFFIVLIWASEPLLFVDLESIFPDAPVMFPILIVCCVCAIIAFIISVCCLVKICNLNVLLHQRDTAESKRISPWFINFFVYGILAIFIPLIFAWLLYFESKKALSAIGRLDEY